MLKTRKIGRGRIRTKVKWSLGLGKISLSRMNSERRIFSTRFTGVAIIPPCSPSLATTTAESSVTLRFN